jgi:hypothetical protein
MTPQYDTTVDNLAKYGPTFQAKVLASLLSSTEFLQQSLDVLNPKFFESNPNAKVIKGMLDEGAKMGISIGAIVKSYEDQKIDSKNCRVYTELELVEASFVAIPSNRHGRAMALAKSFNLDKKGGNKMSEEIIVEKSYSQKDMDSVVLSKTEELNKSVSNLQKQLESKDAELVKAKKELEDSQKACGDKEKEKKKVEEEKEEEKKKKELLETELKSVKSAALEKQQHIEILQNDKSNNSDSFEKNLKEGKLPLCRR